MKFSLLHSFAFALLCVGQLFGQSDLDKATEKFNSNWNSYVLPDCSHTVFHGKDGWYFNDSQGKIVPNHLYLEIFGGGKAHYIAKDASGFHLLDTNLVHQTKKPFEAISFDGKSTFTLLSKGEMSYYVVEDYGDSSDIVASDGSFLSSNYLSQHKPPALGIVTESKFKSKKIERLRLGIDVSTTLTSAQKGSNAIVTKNGEIVFKGLTPPMLYYDFMIAETKPPHAIYHPAYKKVFLTNCDQFWFVDSFLIVSFLGSSEKWILSNSGDVVLTSLGDIRYYEYELGGEKYSFFCDGRSLVNRNGDVIYRSDGELIGVGEHVIYANNRGGYLGDLTKAVPLKYTNFERFGNLTCAQVSRNEWCLLSADSVVISQMDNFVYRELESLLICTHGSATYFVNCKTGEITRKYDVKTNLHLQLARSSDHFIEKTGTDNLPRFGILNVEKGIITESKYRSIGFCSEGNGYVVLTEDGRIEYLNSEGQALFD